MSQEARHVDNELETAWLLLEEVGYTYLHKIGLHDSGLSDICRVPETVEHFLFNCPSNCFLTKSIYDTAEALKHVPSIGLVLSEEPYQQLIYQYVKSHGIRL